MINKLININKVIIQKYVKENLNKKIIKILN